MPLDKLYTLVHFLIDECVDAPARLGAVRLNKSLWFSDVFHYKMHGKKITAERYIKQRMGPVPSSILKVLRQLKDDGMISIEEPKSQFDPRKFHSLVQPEISNFSIEEIETARFALDFVCSEAALKISEITHDIIWESANMGEEIPIYATLASNIAPVSDRAVAWANQVIAQIRE